MNERLIIIQKNSCYKFNMVKMKTFKRPYKHLKYVYMYVHVCVFIFCDICAKKCKTWIQSQRMKEKPKVRHIL